MFNILSAFDHLKGANRMNCYVLTTDKKEQRLFRKILNEPAIYESPRDLLLTLNASLTGSIVILDVAIAGHEHAGFQTAEILRKQNPNSQLILLSNDSSMANACFEYQIGVLDFIIKGNLDLSFQNRLHRAVKKAQYNLHRISYLRPINIHLPDGSKNILVDLAKIIYISSEKGTHHLLLHESNRITKIRTSMKNVATLHENLCQIHAAFCINIDYLKKYDSKKGIVTLTTGNSLPVSRSFAPNIREKSRWYYQPPQKKE